MANLYEINANYLRLMDEIEDNGGDLTPEHEERLKINEQERDSKLKAYYSIIKNKEAEVVMYTEEKNRLNTRQKTVKNLIERLKKSVAFAVETWGVPTKSGISKQIKLDTLTITNKETETVEIDPITFDAGIAGHNNFAADIHFHFQRPKDYKEYADFLNHMKNAAKLFKRINPEDQIYHERCEITIIPDKVRIKEDYEKGIVTPGAIVITNINPQFR